MNKRMVIALLVGVTVFGAAYAMAASLGGIDANNLGADGQVVASCDTDGVGTEYDVVYDDADARYEVASVTVAAIDPACAGQTLRVTLTDGGASLDEGSIVVTGTSETVDMPADPSAEDADDVHLLIVE